MASFYHSCPEITTVVCFDKCLLCICHWQHFCNYKMSFLSIRSDSDRDLESCKRREVLHPLLLSLTLSSCMMPLHRHVVMSCTLSKHQAWIGACYGELRRQFPNSCGCALSSAVANVYYSPSAGAKCFP